MDIWIYPSIYRGEFNSYFGDTKSVLEPYKESELGIAACVIGHACSLQDWQIFQRRDNHRKTHGSFRRYRETGVRDEPTNPIQISSTIANVGIHQNKECSVSAAEKLANKKP